MAVRIDKENPEAKAINLATTHDVEAHIQSLVDLGSVVDRVLNSMVHFRLSIRFVVNELQAARLNAAVTDSYLYSTKELLTEGEVSRKAGVSIAELRKDRKGRFPQPIRGTGRSARYRRTDVDQWLLSSNGMTADEEN